MRAFESLAGQYYGGHYTDSDSICYIHKFTHGLAQAAQRLGVQMHFGCQVEG